MRPLCRVRHRRLTQTPYNLVPAIFRVCEARLAYIPSTKIMFVLAVR